KDVATLLIHAAARGGATARCQCAATGGHGAGVFSAPVRRRCDFTPSRRLLWIALQAAFAAYPRRQKADDYGIPRSA
ncbi:hypothetical protein, partial [Hafnia paralvei]|uniref:hypothetical protein n=1 Tax=Hafnia paralvei TaxID=546367 RepID=UPI001B7FF433